MSAFFHDWHWREFFVGVALGGAVVALLAFCDAVWIAISIAFRGFRR